MLAPHNIRSSAGGLPRSRFDERLSAIRAQHHPAHEEAAVQIRPEDEEWRQEQQRPAAFQSAWSRQQQVRDHVRPVHPRWNARACCRGGRLRWLAS